MSPEPLSRSMMDLLRELAPLRRFLVSPGLDRTFEIIKRELPDFRIHEYPTGLECEDWIIPPSWEVREGYLKDESGTTVGSIQECPLFVAPYSEPVEGWFTKEEIGHHLTTRPDRPHAYALEHRNAYNYRLVDWGITLPHERWVHLPAGRYYVKIVVERTAGHLKVAEAFFPGRRPETLCICAHIDELCNDDLTGCVVAVELGKYLSALNDREYSYQILLAPEMFGTMYYVFHNLEKVKHTIGMLNLETLGAGETWVLKKSLREGTRLEQVLRAALKAGSKAFRERDYLDAYVNDERIFAWPAIDLPGVSLQRHPFPEYHTSEDTPDIVSGKFLEEGLEITKTFVRILESDFVPRYRIVLQPWLTRHGLYFDCLSDFDHFARFNHHVMYNVNGHHSVLDIAEKAGLNFFDVLDFLKRFKEKGFIDVDRVS